MMQSSKTVADFRTSIFPLRTATVVLLGIVGVFGAIATAWFLEKRAITELFERLHFWQENPPFWLTVPEFSNQYFLFLPTIILFGITYLVMKLSPRPKQWSRAVIVSILLVLTIRYVLWRILATLNLSNPLDGTFSIALLVMEMMVVAGGTIQLCLTFWMTDRRAEADKYSQAIKDGVYLPSVDILIPTYNEPEFVLRRTIIGCQAIDYPNKQVYLLDDTRRPEIRQLARDLGCNYITRPDNRYAKAGNLNHAIAKTTGELIAIFDADFIPTQNFLTRTVGFFQKEKIGLVQTPQSFYNPDPIAINLKIDHILPSEEDIFYRHVQRIKDGAGSVVCAGTSFVVRRSALVEVGCFVTDSISEDYYTGIQISARGYELVYLNETLSAGLAAESMPAHILQRLRWARGTLQGFFIDSNPLVIAGLRFKQRLAHLEGYLTWCAIVPRLFFITIPILYSIFGIKPLVIKYPEMIYLFLPYYFIQLNVFSWLNQRSRSVIFSDIFAMVSCFPLFVTMFKVLLNPFGQGFKVTPKGLFRNKYQYNWQLALPLIVFFVGTALSLCIGLGLTTAGPTSEFSFVQTWNIYNLIIISVALLSLLDIPKPDIYEWLPIQQKVRITNNDRDIYGTIVSISEAGAEIELKEPIELNQNLMLEIPERELKLPGKLTHTNSLDRSLKIRVKFDAIDRDSYRSLVETIFCRPGQWQQRNTPGELRSLCILFSILLRPIWFLLRTKKKFA